MRIKIATLLKSEPDEWIGKKVNIKGWVRTVRDQKHFAFLEINDGSSLANLQVLIEDRDQLQGIDTGASVSIFGTIIPSPGKNQNIELKAHEVTILGACDPASYPLQKKRHSFEFLREIAHLRPRTNTQGAVARVRNALAYATHRFFQDRNFLYVHTPIITASDCEGAGELFKVTVLDEVRSKRLEDGTFDYREDFFGKPAYLTVSGQLNGEIYATALSDIYTFGPTFRAENSNTSRHLAEFWMIEPEMAFADLNDNMECAESYVRYCIQYALDNCYDDLAFFDQFIEKGLLQKLQMVASSEFARVTYTDAIEALKKAPKKFVFPVEWGIDLQSEHERYLCEELFKRPVIVTDYPRKIKSFYMRDNDDGKTVAAMDVLVPGIGELIGGSQREERFDILENKIREWGLPVENYWWYLELRKYGTVPHSGFGLGFERLMLFTTGMENIRDVIPFPRFPGHASF